MATPPPKRSIQHLFLQRLLRNPQQGRSHISADILSRCASLGVLTGLGWIIFSSIKLQPTSVQSTAVQSTAVQSAAVQSAGIETAPYKTDQPSSSQTISVRPASELALEFALEQQTQRETQHKAKSNPISAPPTVGQAVNAQVRPAAASGTGSSIRINGQQVSGQWQQRDGRLGVATSMAANLLGVELLSTTTPTEQPVRWFPVSEGETILLPAWWDTTERYLDITDLAARAGWTLQTNGSTLNLRVPQSDVRSIRQGKQTWGDRIVLDLSAPATWQLSESTDGYTITVGSKVSQQLIKDFKATRGNLITQLHAAPLSGRTVIKLRAKDGARPQIWSTGNPNRVVIDVRKDAMVERDIAWVPGLRWRQQYIPVGSHRFPVYLFIVQPDPSLLSLRTIHARPGSAIGIEPIVSQAKTQGVMGAVNAGFFNRNNQLPLGAVRRNSEWISGPILGRGAMAWNDQGDLVMERLALSEVVRTQSGENLPILTVNSGYVQAGIARYTKAWGASYTPLIDTEVVVTVRDDQVTNRQTMGKAGAGSVPIPPDGYLLTLRNNQSVASSFDRGKRVALVGYSQPAIFDQYPHVVGGGPLLIRDRQVVLDPQLEGFSKNFIEGSAPRTAVGKMSDGTWLIATMHDRIGGRGPTLTETAQIMQQLGAVDALNLDGGSSSSLYIGGQLVNRHPRTAARVNNGIGLFVPSGP